MATRLRKVRRLRGSRTHGWGTSGQHRNSGMRGGFGQAGRFRHKKSHQIRYHIPFGKKGFVSPAQKRSCDSALNLGELSEIAEKAAAGGNAQYEGDKLVLDLGQLGFGKLLGMGSITRPLKVKVDKCSASALKKIQDAGGDAVLPKLAE